MQVIAAVAVLALLAAAAFFFFRGGDEETGTGKTTDKEVTIGDLELVVGAVYNANAGAPVQLPVDIQNAVMTTVGSYMQGAVMDPVREGEPAEDIASLFDTVTAPRLEGPDRAVIVEEGLPELTGNFEPAAQPVVLSALSDPAGAFQLVTATVNYSVLFDTDDGQVRSSRFHELTMRPDGGVWKITSYDIVVIREGPGDLTTTTAAAA